jgi:hypothetical protein
MSDRYYLHPASEVRFDKVFRPRSRRALNEAMTAALRADRSSVRSYYIDTLQRLYQQGRFDSLSDERLIRYVVNEVWYGRLVITQRSETGPQQASAGVGVWGAAGIAAAADGPEPFVGDVIAIGILLVGGIAWLVSSDPVSIPIPNISLMSSDQTRARSLDDAETIAWELLEQSCSAQSAIQASQSCTLLFHYTNAEGFTAINAMGGVIRPNVKGWVYATWLPQSPTDVRTGLTFDPRDQGKGDYVIAFTLRPGTVFVPGEQPNELKYRGTLRLGRHADVLYAGPNPLP